MTEEMGGGQPKEVVYKQLVSVGLPMLHLGKDEVPTAILKGKKVDPKEVDADRRKSPGPGEYPIT